MPAYWNGKILYNYINQILNGILILTVTLDFFLLNCLLTRIQKWLEDALIDFLFHMLLWSIQVSVPLLFIFQVLVTVCIKRQSIFSYKGHYDLQKPQHLQLLEMVELLKELCSFSAAHFLSPRVGVSLHSAGVPLDTALSRLCRQGLRSTVPICPLIQFPHCLIHWNIVNCQAKYLPQ